MAEKRYSAVSAKKASGATYTPVELASFVADQMVNTISSLDPGFAKRKTLRILDPAVGDGQLLDSIVARLREALPLSASLEVVGFDLDDRALRKARRRLSRLGARTTVTIRKGDFLSKANGSTNANGEELFDLVIANPPYVRTQVMGAAESRELAKRFGLTGRVDLYHAFVLAIAKSLRPDAVAGIIVSNRFISTKSGKGVREAFAKEYHVQHVWDFGDTKLFDAAVLPAVIVATGAQLPGKPIDTANRNESVRFSSVYESSGATGTIAKPRTAKNVIAAVARNSTAGSSRVRIDDGRELTVQHGRLDAGEDSSQVWRLATRESDEWLATVRKRTWKLFGDIGSIRVGVKTCADKVFIRDDWDSFGKQKRPELLKRLTTHHVARPFRAKAPSNGKNAKQILYPHRAINGRRDVGQLTVDLDRYPNSKAYLLSHSKTLKSRKYVTNAGRQWYEIWVPQDPAQWKKIKLVFRDIAAEPCFWIDKTGSVINGDCYWMTCDDSKLEDLLWLAAAVGNSTFIEQFYDHRFHNKLYAGRRRFLTQYVREFPLPKPSLKRSQQIVEIAKSIHAAPKNQQTPARIEKANRLVWQAFGLRAP